MLLRRFGAGKRTRPTQKVKKVGKHLITFGQLFLAVSLPTVVALVGVILNQNSNKELQTEVKNFRIEMAKELGAVNTRMAVMETKLNIAQPAKPEVTKDVAA